MNFSSFEQGIWLLHGLPLKVKAGTDKMLPQRLHEALKTLGGVLLSSYACVLNLLLLLT